MKKFNLFLLFTTLIFLFVACEKKVDDGLAKIRWDRDTCERCVMVMSEKSYAVQTQNPKTKQKFKFDDFGCAVLWFKENNKNWFEKAVIWVKDEKSQEWINARTATWTHGNITPMNYGFAAYTQNTIPMNKKIMNFDEAILVITKQDREDKLRRQHKMHKKGNL